MSGAAIFVIKVASRCNLACAYCYMYNHADQGWRNQPRFMSRETVRHFAGRLSDHAMRSGATDFKVIVHGGEPLLYPDLEFFFKTLAQVPSVQLRFSVQTNGTLINDEVIPLLERHNVGVGVSLDGPREVHDVARRTHKGRGSFDSVMRGIDLLRRRSPNLLEGALQVVDTRCDPVDAVRFLETLGVPAADFLFPHLNHNSFAASGLEPGMLGQWLIDAFNYWCEQPDSVQIKIFVTIAHLLLGGKGGSDQLGEESQGILIVETDGSYEIHDNLKTCFDGAGRTGMTVRTHPIDAVSTLPLMQAFQVKRSGACAKCLACSLFPVCGGGCPAHRYKTGIGFSMPSVFCRDLEMLIRHIALRLSELQPDSLVDLTPQTETTASKLCNRRKSPLPAPAFADARNSLP